MTLMYAFRILVEHFLKKIIEMKNIFIAFFLVVITLSSCLKEDYDFNEISLENYNPAVAAPIVNTRLTLHDLIGEKLEGDSSLLSIDEDSLLWVTTSSRLFQMGVSDLFEIPDENISQSFIMDPFSISDLNENVSVTLGDVVSNFSDPEKTQIQSADGLTAPFPAIPSQSGGEHNAGTFSEFSSVNFTAGTLTLTVTNNWPIDLNNLILEIKNSDNSVLGTVTYPSIPAGTSLAKSIDLTGKTMDNAIKANIVNIESPGSGGPLVTVPISLADDIAINIASTSLAVSGGTAIFPSSQVLNDVISVDMDLGNGETLNSLKLKNGSIEYSIDYGIRETAKLTLSLPYATLTEGGPVFSKVIDINSNNVTSTTVSGSIDLSGYTIDLTAGGTGSNQIDVRIEADVVSSNIPVPFAQTDGVDADFTLANLEIEFLDGDLGTQTFTLATDTVDFGFSELDFDADITLADPRLTLSITNSFGMELGINLGDLVAENETTSQPLIGLGLVTIGAPGYGSFTDSVTTPILINTVTTNIADVLAIKPNKLIFGMTGSTNPGAGPFNNFITDESYLSVAMDIEVPLYGSVDGFQLVDTLDFPVEAFENVLTGLIRTQIKNEFPVNVRVQAYFVDEDFVVLDSLSSTAITVLKSIDVDGDGEMLGEVTENETDIELTEIMVNNIKNAAKIILVSNLSTAESNSAKFYTNYGMDIQLGVYAKVKVELKKDEEATE